MVALLFLIGYLTCCAVFVESVFREELGADKS